MGCLRPNQKSFRVVPINKINNRTNNTGVEATVNGFDLLIQSVESGGFVTFELINGIFVVSGLDGKGTVHATPDVASARGVDGMVEPSAFDGNRLTVVDNHVHYRIELAAGFTGDFGPIQVGGAHRAIVPHRTGAGRSRALSS